VIAVELDGRLAARLRETCATAENFVLIEGDVLAFEPAVLLTRAGQAPDSAYSVVANLPYNAGAAIVRHFLEAANRPRRMVVMLQREVAAGMAAAPGDLGVLGIGVQVYAEAKRLFNVPPRAFVPPPKVVSTVLRLDSREEPRVPAEERPWFFEVVRAGFSAPRKQLRNSLAQGLGREPRQVVASIEAAGIDATARPETLGIEDWLRLSRWVGPE
jgi:16S rRNA (adenine1518-N6/adenine1519-N6)-dimethyltransferase